MLVNLNIRLNNSAQELFWTPFGQWLDIVR